MSNNFLRPELLGDVEFKTSDNSLNSKDWNWVSSPEIDPNEVPANYYESSLAPWHTFGSVETDLECDVVVIGAGLLGTSTALHLAEHGVDTILIDKDRVGSAASGRNGGQLTPGLARWEAADMIKQFSYEEAKKLWHFTSVESMQLIDDLASRYALNIDRKQGHITAAVHAGHMLGLGEGSDARKYLGEDHTQLVGKHELYDYIKSDNYFGGVIDHLGGHVHPLALTRGLAYGFLTHGGRIFENTCALSVDEQADGVYIKTEQGVIKAKKGVVLAVHSSTFELLKENRQTTIPFYTYVGVTAPLDIDTKELLPYDHPVYDTQLQIDYYRSVSKNRLLFGGQGTGTCWGKDQILSYLQDRIGHVFPQIQNLSMDFAWSGTTDLTVNGATDNRKSGDQFPIYAVHGWSGHGVAQTVRIGKAIAEDFVGKNTADFSMLTQIQHTNIPFGRTFAPVAIPIAKCLLTIQAAIQPGKILSF